MSGGRSCCIPVATGNVCGRDLNLKISSETGICECRLQLAAGNYRVQSRTPIDRIQKWMQPSGFMYAIQRNMHASGFNAAGLIADGFCFKCMKQAGVQADEILALPRDIDAGALKAAGYSMNELLSARAGLPHLFFHPPATNRTLFDSQLQLAGYSAADFRNAGYDAGELCYIKHLLPLTDAEDLTPGVKE